MSLSGLELVRFPAATTADGSPDARTLAWDRAAASGFHETAPAADSAGPVGNVVRDGRVYTSVVDTTAPEGLDGLATPVATYATFGKPLHLGSGREIDGHLITGVTVRPTHRRRGILRELITTDLRDAHERGLPVALLTASEGAIYRRFGFGRASFTRTVRVDTGPRFALETEPSGRVELVSPAWLVDRIEEVFDRFHATTAGSVGRQSRYRDRSVGRGDDDKAPSREVRAAVHVDDSGTLDGYVTWRATGTDDTRRPLEVVDLVAATPDAHLGLWQLLGSVDLAHEVRWDSAPVEDPLEWALRDPRVVSVDGVDDVLWARILDPIAAFGARPYSSDGTVAIAVTDALGYAEGVFRIEAARGTGTLAPADYDVEPDLALDVADLGSLLLGTVRPSLLARAGSARIRAGEGPRLDAFFAPLAAPYCISHF